MAKACHFSQDIPLQLDTVRCVAFVGNPNTGKTTVFNALTGLNQRVGNFPGVTVERKTGLLRGIDTDVMLIDLPGCYSLAARSPDEMVAIDVLLGRIPDLPKPDIVVVVLDASNLERNLYLATQLLEIGIPVIYCLNMMDVAESAGIEIDVERLSSELGASIVPTSALKRRGLNELRELLADPSSLPAPKPIADYPELLHSEVKRLYERFGSNRIEALPSAPTYLECQRMLLEVGGSAEDRWISKLGTQFTEALQESRRRLHDAGHDLVSLETHIRYNQIGKLLCKYIRVKVPKDTNPQERLGRHPHPSSLRYRVLFGSDGGGFSGGLFLGWPVYGWYRHPLWRNRRLIGIMASRWFSPVVFG